MWRCRCLTYVCRAVMGDQRAIFGIYNSIMEKYLTVSAGHSRTGNAAESRHIGFCLTGRQARERKKTERMREIER
jgi:hypothetical protein